MSEVGFSRRVWTALAAAAVSLAVAGDRAVCASAPEEPSKSCLAGAGPAAAPLPITLDATLTGTVLVDSGRSLALFDPTGGAGLMREGDAFADGTLLCEVRVDRIIVGRGGNRREIFVGEKGQPSAAASPRIVSAPGPEAAVGPTVFAPVSPQPPVALRPSVFAPAAPRPAVASGQRPGVSAADRATLLDVRAANFHAILERRTGQPAD
jgi:hypothetical protein